MWIVEINGNRYPTWKGDDLYELSDNVDKWKFRFRPYGFFNGAKL